MTKNRVAMVDAAQATENRYARRGLLRVIERGLTLVNTRPPVKSKSYTEFSRRSELLRHEITGQQGHTPSRCSSVRINNDE